MNNHNSPQPHHSTLIIITEASSFSVPQVVAYPAQVRIW